MNNITDYIKARVRSLMIRFLEQMFVCFTLSLLFCTNSWAQTYNHDNPVMNQFTVQETGLGSLQPPLYYQLLHSSYYKTAASKNKLLYRTHMSLRLESERPYAERIDSAMANRVEIEGFNLADRMNDAAWLVEKDKIETKLRLFKSNIEKITLYGGTAHDYDEWLDIYNCIQCGITALQRSYLPDSERHREYLAIYADIRDRNYTLVGLLLQWQGMKDIKSGQEQSVKVVRARVESIAQEAKGRWKIAWTAGAAPGHKQSGQ